MDKVTRELAFHPRGSIDATRTRVRGSSGLAPQPSPQKCPHPRCRWARARAALSFLTLAFLVGLAGSGLAAKDERLMAHWLFDQNHVHGQRLQAAAGGLHGVINGPVSLDTSRGPTALAFDGRQNSVLLGKDLSSLPLPKRQLTVEAWVIVDKPQDWGGLAGVIQDNGDFERGWLLGFVGSQFSLALASTNQGRLTYLKAAHPFEPGQWHHVVGTYDGSTLKVFVNGQLEASSTEQSGDILYPPAGVAVLGAYQDDNEFYPLNGVIREVLIYHQALLDAEVQARYEASRGLFPSLDRPAKPFRVATGPFVEWASPAVLNISWTTEEPTPSVLEFARAASEFRQLVEPQPKTNHALALPDVQPNTVYAYRLRVTDSQRVAVATRTYRFDSTFNYELPPRPVRPAPFVDGPAIEGCRMIVDRALDSGAPRKGYCLILGAGEGRLAFEVARRTECKVLVLEPDAGKAESARRTLDQAGLYGVRVTVHVGGTEDLPYGNYFANLVLSESLLTTGQLPGNPAEVYRCLRPNGGVLFLGQPEAPSGRTLTVPEASAWLARAGIADGEISTQNGLWVRVRRGPLPGAGEWTHMYGGADNSACSQDQLVKGPMSVLWWGEPGPRPMPDRGGRNPAAVSAHGRLYVQGDRLVFGIDAFNGTVLWAVGMPELRRANVPRDCSNMAASPDYLYLASGAYVCGLNGQTGAREMRFKVPEDTAEEPYDWGYVGVVENLLLGSATRQGAAYLGDDGEWYDSASAADVAIVCSDYLFGQDRHTGANPWIYRGGVILNPTITIGDGIVFLIESRNPEAKAAKSGRLGREVYRDQALVALDLRTGQKLWEQPTDFSGATRMVYLAYADHTLVVAGSSQTEYHLWAYDAPERAPTREPQPGAVSLGGSKLWETRFPMAREDHGGALQHPLLVGGGLYLERRAFDLRAGRQVRDDLPERRGCGMMAAARNAFFYRHYYHSMWDLETDQRTEYLGIRGGCWIGMIPSGGLVLAPETSSGCSCTHAIQTSMAFLPTAALKPDHRR